MALKSAFLVAFIFPHLLPALELREAGPHGGVASLLEESGSKGLSVQELSTESNRHMFAKLDKQLQESGNKQQLAMKQSVLRKVADAIVLDKRQLFQHLSMKERVSLAARVAHQDDTTLIDLVAPSSASRPVLLAPVASTPKVNYGSKAMIQVVGAETGKGDFQPSADFQSSSKDAIDASELTEAASELPWGVGSPRAGDSLPNFHYSYMPSIDFPKEWEYSLDSGDTIRSFSNNNQDVKLITQLLMNITNGFFLDTNAGNGEHPSNTLLLELSGWRGLIMEPRGYQYLDLWSKMRKAWLFLGCISPHENSTKIGFNTDGEVDMQSGHMIHAHSVPKFMEEMGGRKTIDFWNLNSGGYEVEILNETLLGSGKFLEFGVIMVTYDGRRWGRGYQEYVTPRSRDATEDLLFDVMHRAGFKFVGGLDPYFVVKRQVFRDGVWVNPKYFEARGWPTPTVIKSAPPPLGDAGFYTAARMEVNKAWDSGMSHQEEVAAMMDYFAKSREAAGLIEPIAKAHRVNAMTLNSN